MEISNLIGKIRGTDKDSTPTFLALELTDELVQAAVWQVTGGKTEIVAIGSPVEWDGDQAKPDELAQAADSTISSATEGIEPEPSEIIFGVAGSWAEGSGILPGKLALIKKICRELELKPLGFVVIQDSLVRYLKLQEGTPTTSILIHVGSDTVSVFLVRLGQIEATETIGRSTDLAADVEEGISRFPGDANLPSRMIVFSSVHNLDEEMQNLNSYDWKSKFNFLHIPKMEKLPQDVAIRSVAVAGGMEVAKSIGFDITEPEAAHAHAPLEPAPEKITLEPDSDDQADDDLLAAADLGFSPSKKLPPTPAGAPAELEPDIEEPSPVASPVSPKLKLPKVAMPQFRLPRLKLAIPAISAFNLGKPAAWLGAVIFVLLVVAAGAIWLIPKASVHILVETKEMSPNLELVLSAAATAVDPENGVIPASPVETEVDGEETIPTTGKKTVGEPSQGGITLFNRTTQAKTFPKNTVLTAKSLKFTLTESVTVASKSAGTDYVDVPGKATASIAASAIGSDGNLPAETEFTIENFSKDTYVARNPSALSGGSSRETEVVAQADKDLVTETLLAKLRDTGRIQLKAESGQDTEIYILEGGSETLEQSYSADVGAEAASLTASLRVRFKGLRYSPSSVESLLSSTSDQAIPAGFTRTADPPIVELGQAREEGDDAVEVTAKVTLKLLPAVDEARIKQSVRGLPSASVPRALSDVMEIKDAKVDITPLWLPPRLKRMPRNPANISVVVTPAT